MEPAHFAFGGGSSGTLLHPLVALWMLIAVVLIFTLQRKKIIVPFLLIFFSVPTIEVIVVAGLHFTMHQILILAVLARMVTSRKSSEETFAGGLNALDKVVILWTLSALIIFCLQWMEMQAVIKGFGDLVVSLGGYLAA